MGFSISPSVTVREWDLSGSVPQVSSTDVAFAGVFRWGPLGVRVLIDTENTLVNRFGKPTNLNPETFFTASSFLSYGNLLHISRAANTSGLSPTFNCTVTSNNATIVTTNTAGLAVGMFTISSSNSAISNGAIITSIVNSTAFTIDANTNAILTTTDTIQVVSNNSVFTSMANTASVSNLAYQIVKNDDDFNNKAGSYDQNIQYLARCPGFLGDSLKVSTCDSATAFTSTANLAAVGNGGATVALAVGSNTATVTVTYGNGGTNAAAQAGVNTAAQNLLATFQVTDYIQFGNNTVGTQSLQLANTSAISSNVNSTVAVATFTMTFNNTLKLSSNQTMATTLTRYWEYYDYVDVPPGQSDYVRQFGNGAAQDEMHIVIADQDGKFTGVPGTVLETYKNLSRANNALTLDGSSLYYKTVINNGSQYAYAVTDRVAGYSNTALNISSVSNTSVQQISFICGQNGSDEGAISIAELATAYDMFASAEDIDISLVLQGKARGGAQGAQLGNYIIDNLCETRRDCFACISPAKTAVVGAIGFEADNCVAFRNALRNTSYACMDSGYKYMYDRYNDLYRWIPLNGDMGGLMVRTDFTNDPWWSPAGLNRGQIKNLVKLAWNPRKAFRDQLYKSDINPVVTFPGQGTVLWGDKTLLGKPSAFSRINVRRSFLVYEKAIATAAKYFEFEFNDAFTRALFVNQIVPYFREVMGKRGLYDFKVVCDETNNTPEIIDENTLVGDIYLKPAKSINYITLNFVAVRTGTAFTEVIGKFGG